MQRHSYVDQFAFQASTRPGAIAIAREGETLTYGALDARANHIAAALSRQGAGGKAIVGLFLPAGPDYVAALLGTGKTGAAFLPLPPDLPEKRLRAYLDKAQTRFIVTDAAHEGALRDRLAATRESAQDDIRIVVIADQAAEADAFTAARIGPTDPAYVMFTSGSTGAPKAILGAHRSLSHFLRWEIGEFDLDDTTRGSWLAPITFDVSLRDILVPLMVGGTLIAVSEETRTSPRRLVDTLLEAGVTLVHCVPTVLRLLTQELASHGETAPLPALRHLLVAGEPLFGADVAAWRAAAGETAEVVNLYGPSETTLAKVFHRVGELPADLKRVLPIGRPLPDTRVLVLTRGRASAPQQIGEIHIETAYPSLGYLGDPELTSEAFIANPLGSDGPLLYRTGDLGRILPDGVVECLGRQDNQVKINGVRIELGEVEAVLRTIPGVKAAAAAVHPGAGDVPVLVGYYVRTDGGSDPLPAEALRAELDRSLPAAMQPRVLVPLAALPTTISGKLNRKALPRPEELFYAQHGYVEATTATETALAAIWAGLFGLEKIGVETRFHDFGGDSLRAIRAVQLIYQSLSVEVSLKDFFEASTIRALGRLIDATNAPASAPGVGIARAPDADSYPVTSSQSRLWRLDRLGVAPTAYNLFDAYELAGAVDVPLLEEAFRRLIARHEALRTTFREDARGEAVQVIHDTLPWRLEQADLRGEADPAAEAQRLAAANGEHRFDLVAGPLLRVVLVRLPDVDGAPAHVLLFNIHHIVADVWSLGVLVNDLAEIYRALRHGGEPALPALAVQMRDVAVWQSERADSGALDGDRDYWLKRFETPVAALELPRDRPRPPVQTLNGGTVRFVLDAGLLGAVEALANRAGVTVFVALTALTKAFLHRYGGQRELVLGCPVAGRRDSLLDNQIGYYVNILALRDSLPEGESFSAFLARVAGTVGEALVHQDYPFDKLVSELPLERDMSRSPLFDAMIVFQNFAQSDLTLDGVAIHPFGARNAWNFSRYDLVFHFQEEDGALVLDLNYNSDLFDTERVARMAAQFGELARAAVEEPQQPMDALSLLPASETARIAAFSAGPVTAPAHATIAAAFRAAVSAHAERVAVEDEAGRALTYAALDAASDRLAHALAGQGIGAGDRVAVLARRSLESVVALLGIVKAGAVYVPVDPGLPRARIDLMLEQAACRLILADTDAERLDGADLPQVAVAPVLAATAAAAPVDRSAASEVAYVIFTSGSTGTPKAVMVEHAGFVNMSLAQIEAFGITAEDRVLQFASPSFDASLANIFMALFAGAAVVLPARDTIENTEVFRDVLAQSRTSVVTLPPTYLRALDRAPLPGLKVLITAGEAAPVDDLVHYSRSLRAYNAYGPTEFSVCATIHRVRPADAETARLPIGRPLPNTTVHILNADLAPTPIGVPGEICLGGRGLARGYQNDDERTARAFVIHPRTGERLYRTGDIGFWRADGTVDCLGRLDEQVKVAGNRIDLGEVETALRELPGLRDVHVATITREGGGTALAAYYCTDDKVELWPSVAEFYVYDDVAYGAMASDEGRNDRYRAAFARHLPGKIVVDIGTGPVAILARLAVEAGARKVYAVDRLAATARKARETVEKLGLSDRIEVIHGDALTVELPEKADVCISEIVGAIGGAEGSARIINSVRRLLKDPGAMLPQFSDTRIAALSLPADRIATGFPDIAAHYVEKIFAEVGQPFDLRLCLKNCPRNAIVSDDGPFEYLDYVNDVPLEADDEMVLTITRDCDLTGFLVWLQLGVDTQAVVDILDNPGSWLPIYVPVFDTPVAVAARDTIALTVSRRLCANGFNTDYILDGTVRRAGGEAIPFRYASDHFGGGFRRTPFYERLFRDGAVVRQEAPTAAVLRQHLLNRLPAYAVPAWFIRLGDLPVTLNGKVDKAALPQPAAASTSSATPAAPPVEPTVPLEAEILAIWREVMNRDDIGTAEDFFSLGGDSIRAIQIVSRLRQAGWKADIRDVFQNPTVAALARVVKPLRVQLDQGPVTGDLPLTPIQQWFFETATTRHHFNQGVLLRAPRIDPQAAQTALAALWSHHDALRSRFTTDAVPSASIRDAGTPPTLARITLEGDAAARRQALEDAADRVHAGFSLDGTPLLAALLASGPDGDALLLAAHHLVVDAVSWGILLEDFETAYAAAARGAQVKLPQKTNSYRDHAAALDKILARVDWANRLTFWRGLGGIAPLLPERTAPGSLARSITLEGQLTRQETADLLESANRAHATNVQDLLLAALGLALKQHFNRDRALVTVEGHGREYPFADVVGEELPDVSRTVGWFTTFHPLEVRAEGDDIAATIRAAKDSARRTPDQGWTYGLIRQLGAFAEPRPQVSFNYLGVLGGGERAGTFTVDWTIPGRPLAADTARAHAIDILASVEDGLLRVGLSVDDGPFDAAGAERLLAGFLAAVRAVLAHCLSHDEAVATSFTYGDFSHDDLDRLLLVDL